MVGSENRRKVAVLVACLVACVACSATPAQELGERGKSAPDAAELRVAYPIGLNADRAVFAQALRWAGSAPALSPAPRRRGGLGEINWAQGTLIWGLGPSIVRPTAPHDPLGAGRWSAGLASIALAIDGAQLYGVLASDRCSLAGDVDGGGAYGLVIQPFVNYNLPDGWYIMSVPVISADWMAPSDQRWTVPMGGGIGRSVRVGDMPLSVQAGYYYNLEKPDGAPDWMVRLEVRLLFRG